MAKPQSQRNISMTTPHVRRIRRDALCRSSTAPLRPINMRHEATTGSDTLSRMFEKAVLNASTMATSPSRKSPARKLRRLRNRLVQACLGRLRA